LTAAKETDEQSSVVLGVVVAPGLAEDVTARIAGDLADDLDDAYGTVEWRTELAVDRLVVPPVPTTEIVDAARRKLLDQNWDLAVIVTDLPLPTVGGALGAGLESDEAVREAAYSSSGDVQQR
jgi:hypothetical protein